jgi:hypothetical protein
VGPSGAKAAEKSQGLRDASVPAALGSAPDRGGLNHDECC